MADEAKKKFRALDTIQHDGETYGPGIEGKTVVEMTEAQAAALPAGVVEAIAAKAAGKTTDGKTTDGKPAAPAS